MSVFSSIKNWFKKTFGGGSSGSKVSRARTVSNYGGGGSRSYKSYADGGYTQRASAESEEERMKRLQRERQKKQEQITKNLSSITDAKSAGKVASSTMNSISGMERVTKKINERAKATPPDPKQKAAEQSHKRAVAQLKRIDNATQNVEKKLNDLNERIVKQAEEDRKSFNKATNDRYNVEKNGQQARIAQKMQAFDPDAAKWSIERHPIAESAARGALSGVTFGASELAARYLPRSEESREVEDFYQKNKNQTAEIAGEVAGSLLGFGATADLSVRAAKALTPKAILNPLMNTGARKAESLATKQIIRRAAEREAIKRFGAEGATKEIIEQIAKRRAGEVMASIGRDLAINATTGLVMDASHATMNSDNVADFAKNMAISAGLNTAIGGAATFVPALIAGRRMGSSEIARLASAARNNADDVAETVARNADEVVRPPAIDEAVRPQAVEAPRNWQNDLVDANDFDQFVQANMQNPEFVAFGRDNPESIEGVRRLWREIRMEANKQNLRPISKEEAVESAREIIPESLRDGWFRNADSGYKPMIEDTITSDPEALNAGLNIAYHNYLDTNPATKLSFEEWLETPQVMYRGVSEQGKVTDDVFSAFTPDRKVAEKFAGKGGRIEEVTVRPVDTYGSYQTTAEQEFLVPESIVRNNPEVTVEQPTPRANAEDAVRTEPPAKAPERATPPKVADDFPVEGTPEAAEMNRAIRNERQAAADAYKGERDALERRVDEIAEEFPRAEEDKPLRIINGEEDEVLGGTTPGLQKSYSAYERNTGEQIEDGVKTSWHDAWKALQEYHASHGTGEAVRKSKTSVSQLNAMKSDAERELRDKMAAQGWLDYTVIHSEDILDKVSKQFRDDPSRWVEDMIDVNSGRTLDFRETPEWAARVHYIMAVVDPSADAASEIAYTEAYKLATAMASKAGQTNNLRRQFVHLTPAGRRDAIMDEMAQILYKSKGFADRHRDMPRDKYDALAYIKSVLEDDPEIERRVQRLVKAGGLAKDAEYGTKAAAGEATEIGVKDAAKVADEIPMGDTAKATDELTAGAKPKKAKASKSDELTEAHADLMLALNEHNPKTAFDTIQEIRYLNMLGNPKTHIRNIFGSAFFSPMRQASNQVRSLIEDSIAKNAGLEITKHGGISLEAMSEAGRKAPKTEAGKKALEAYERVKSDLLSGAKLETRSYAGRSKTAAGKTLDKLSDFNSNLLAGEDNFFKERAFRENYIKSYNKYVKKKVPITEKLERQIEAEAMQEARIATFNEYNEFAKWLANITNKAYDANASAGARLGGTALNAVMPFTKVPTNIANQSLNYSPIGIARGFAGIKNAAKKGDAAALNKAIDQLASGLTGTAVFGMGMLLGKTSDAFTTNAGKNDEAAKFKKRQGVQNYSVTFTDPTSGEKYSATLDWLVPTSATFFSGVEMGNQMKKGDLDLLGLGMDWSQVMSRLAEPVLESSMLSGLYNMLESTREGYGGDDTKSALSIMLRELAQSYTNSLVPTVAGQTARTLYKTDKQVSGDTDWEYFRNSMKQKTGLAADNAVTRKLGIEPLGADTDAYGNVKGEKKETSDYVKSALKNFISPANIQKVDLSEIDEKKIKQYEDAIKKGEDPTEMAYLFPKKQYKKQFSVGDMNVEMSNKDLSTYNQAKTKGGEEGMRFVLENIMFNRPTTDADGNKVLSKDAYTKEQKQKLMNQFKGKSLREVEEWLYKQPQFKKASEAEKKRAINGLWNLSGQGKSQGAKRVGEQAVIKAQGGDVDEYNFKNELSDKKQQALQPFIDNGILTYAEAVDFARNAGKTYYYENEDGGSSNTYFNKKQMIEYLQSKGYSYEKAEALFNAFKAGNAKPYDGSSSSSGYRRRGYRRRGYRRGGGGYSKKAKVPAPKKISASSFTKGQALVSKTSSSKSSSSKSSVPELKRVKAKIDLPTPKK